jgi:hypothetical protein
MLKSAELRKERRELLLKVYSAAIDEYRFNVTLGWDRTKFFLLLNSGFIAAGIGLFKISEASALESTFLALYFLLSVAISAIGLDTVAIGKSYYREAVFKKTLVERELGLLKPIADLETAHGQRATFSIAVTKGQQDFEKILTTKKIADAKSTSISFGSIANYIRAVFWAMIVMETLFAAAAAVNASKVFSGS